MDPDAVMVVVLMMTFLSFIYLMVRSKHKHELKKLDRIAEGNADRSLTTRELEDLVRDIVSDVTEPLRDRLDDLSRQLDSGVSRALLDPEQPEEDASSDEKTLGRRTRV